MTTTSPVLQPESGTVTSPAGARAGYLPAMPRTVLWGRLPCATDQPAVTIDPGTSLVIDTVSHEGILEDQGRDPYAFFTHRGIPASQILRDAATVAAEVDHDPSADGPHVVTGPIEVRGARPGDILSMTVEDLQLRCRYGVVSNRHGRGALPDEFPLGGSAETVSILCRVEHDHRAGLHGSMPVAPGSARNVRFPLAPFLGTMGVAVAQRHRPNSVPPGAHGGNIDVALLTRGATLHVPVQVPGALAYVGDPHFAQGDGEVALTAFEAPLRARIRFDVVPAEEFPARPLWAETADLLVPIGLHHDLADAMRQCVRAAVQMLVDRGMHPAHAYAYLSAAGDFAISQVVDQVTGVHGKIRKSDLAELLLPTSGL
ncbi:acetamidase/formamidase family protein [Dactylosporangium sucinum]|uniref:Formamidase n=1 Tax=Dactylosporangium sucinum TaxID=1424081 RepID=A0A917X794_9ACTN|nr:acetamidase/formamidase family protein [Dactylosporangium sucinum]GGM81499.1 formamidase [Dactylosporangium sucinum]